MEDELNDYLERIEKKWYEMGFREGVLQGKIESSQSAFDLGYHIGAIEAFLSKTEGKLSPERTEALREKLSNLYQETSK